MLRRPYGSEGKKHKRRFEETKADLERYMRDSLKVQQYTMYLVGLVLLVGLIILTRDVITNLVAWIVGY